MANQEHLEILKQGVEAWKQWRKGHPDVEPNLSFGVFIRTDLSRANFKSTILHRTTFTGEAPLGNDFLKGDFLMAQESLCNIDLSGADLRGTYFFQPILDETDFSYASITQTIFRNIDLRQLKGLDKCEFGWRSSIDIDSIYLSQGKIPEVFLKGAGVPDSFIEYMRSLVSRPIDYRVRVCWHPERPLSRGDGETRWYRESGPMRTFRPCQGGGRFFMSSTSLFLPDTRRSL